MLKVVLQYTSPLYDGNTVFRILASHGVTILKTKGNYNPKVTIIVKDYPALNRLLHDLNRACDYEVRVMKTKMIKENNIYG